MPLTHIQCENAKPQSKLYRLSDGKGLYLQIMPKGQKYWHYRYTFHGKQKCLALGIYPEMSLAQARAALTDSRDKVQQNIDPQLKRREEKQLSKYSSAQTFKAIAEEWHELNKDNWTERHAAYVLRRLELHTFGEIGNYPISNLTPALMMACLQKIEKTGPEMARRVMSMCSRIFQYAIATGRGEKDLTIGLKYGLKKYKAGRYASISLDELPELINKIYFNDARLYKQTHLCLKMMLLTAVRTSELIEAKWNEIDFDKALWVIPAERMKTRKLHKVPLSKQAISILQELKVLNGKRDFVFPSIPRPRKPMSNATILKALENLGYKYKMTGHGFRSLFMGICKQCLGYRHEPVDRQLAHAPRNSIDRAYDRADYLPERIIMMQEYADYLDSILYNKPYERKIDEQSNQIGTIKSIPTSYTLSWNGGGYETAQYKSLDTIQRHQTGALSETLQSKSSPQRLENRGHSSIH